MTQTIRAHRLCRKALDIGGQELQEKFLDVIFKAYFTEGKNVGDFDVLADISEQVGVLPKEKVRTVPSESVTRASGLTSRRQALEFLRSNEYQEEIRQMAEEARRKGVTGVPFTIINGRWAVSGGQASETYAQVRCWVS